MSLADQRVDVWRGLEFVESSKISTGKPGYETPSGVYSILQKNSWHRSNIYSNAPMPFMQRLTWSGIALHEGRVPNRPASHGCIRLPRKFARKMFGNTSIGVQVPGDAALARTLSQYRDVELRPTLKPWQRYAMLEQDAEPVRAETPADDPAHSIANFEETLALHQAWESRSREPLRILITRRTGRERVKDAQRMLINLGYDPSEVDGYMGHARARPLSPSRKMPVSRPAATIRKSVSVPSTMQPARASRRSAISMCARAIWSSSIRRSTSPTRQRRLEPMSSPQCRLTTKSCRRTGPW